MAWSEPPTERDFFGFANSSATVGGAAVNGSATSARSLLSMPLPAGVASTTRSFRGSPRSGSSQSSGG